jgi:vacuolar iron transporter family protein
MSSKARWARPRPHNEGHVSSRGAWLRAAILGADDGIVSTSSLIIGVAASTASKHAVLVAGVAGLVAGALSMAAGEYVSVSSQRDAEEADIDLEKWELDDNPAGELRELAHIYEKRGLDTELALRVAEQLSRKDRLESHLRDELGISDSSRARPIQAALASAASFSSLALVPLGALLVAPERYRIVAVAAAALASLGFMGALGAYVAGAERGRGALRVLIGGGLAMAISALIGRLFGVQT